MEWIKGIRQLHSARDILEELVDNIVAGKVSTEKDVIPRRIETVRHALEDAKKYFLEEDV